MDLEKFSGMRPAWKGTLLVNEYLSEDDFRQERYKVQSRIDGILIEDLEELPKWMRKDAESRGYTKTNPDLVPQSTSDQWYVALDADNHVIEYQAHVGLPGEGRFIPKYGTTDGL